MSSWVDALFKFIDKDGSNAITVTELVSACMPDAANVWDCTGQGACVKVTLSEETRRRVGTQGALRYLMQVLAMDTTYGDESSPYYQPTYVKVMADDKISLRELRMHASESFYDLFEMACEGASGGGDCVARVLPEYVGYFHAAVELIRLSGFSAEADEMLKKANKIIAA